MRKNEAGLTILEKGDVVRIGKGKVLYTVEYGETAGMIHVTSHNTGKSQAVERERLNLVESVQSVAYTAGCSVEELTGVSTKTDDAIEDYFVAVEQADYDSEALTFEDVLSGAGQGLPEEKPAKVRNMDQMREDLANGNPEFTEEEIKQNTRTQQGVAKARAKRKPATTYQKAVLFALNKLGKHVYAGTVRDNVKAKRRSLNLRQKASRKANR